MVEEALASQYLKIKKIYGLDDWVAQHEKNMKV
ncbi:hypothetical protein [Niabella ginsengisoli]